MAKKKPSVRIERWRLYGSGLEGAAYGHPRFDDGTHIHTSFIVDMPDNPKKGDIVETNNTLYELGDPYSVKELED